MIHDMTARHFGEKTQKDYCGIHRPRPETATAEDLRIYRLHLVQSPLGAARVNSAMTALPFFSASRSTGTTFASPGSASNRLGSCPQC